MSRERFERMLVLVVAALLIGVVSAASMGTIRRAQGEPIVSLQADEGSPTSTPPSGSVIGTRPPLIVPGAGPTRTPRIIATRRPTRTPTITPSPTASKTPRPTRTPRATRTPTAAPSATPAESPTPRPTSTEHPPSAPTATAHFWLRRPINPGANDSVAYFYPYGSTGDNTLQIHHGVEFVNPEGTPVVAAGDGTVVYAGTDDQVAVGPVPIFYGNVVVIQHPMGWLGQPLFTLYGHLKSFNVTQGQEVKAGDEIGLVGMTGIALGPHLHFEVRVGANNYAATRNPELWLPQHEGNGLIAGRVLDEQGRRVPLTLVTVQRPDEQLFRRAATYPNESINSDEELDENIVIGDIPAGRWLVAATVNGRTVVDEVTVRPGEISWVHLQPKPLP